MQKENKACNITPANRVGSVQEYYFSKKLKEVAEMNAAGKNVINLGVGSPDLPPSEQTIETLCEHARKANEHGYQSRTWAYRNCVRDSPIGTRRGIT